MIDRVAFGKRMKKLREERGMSQKQLAIKVNQTEKFIDYAERGFGFGVDDELSAMLHVVIALDTSFEYLINGTKNAPTLREKFKTHNNN